MDRGAPTPGYVKLLLPPRQSRGNSPVGLDTEREAKPALFMLPEDDKPLSLQVLVELHALCHASQHTCQIMVAMWVNSRQFLESACPRCITISSLSELVWMT